MNYLGQWWFPKYPFNLFEGKFTFNKKQGGRLRINGPAFHELENDDELNGNNIIINGHTNNGNVKDITLITSKLNKSFHEVVREQENVEIHSNVNRAFIGIRFANMEEIKLTSLTVNYKNCAKWLTDFITYENKEIKRKYEYFNNIQINDKKPMDSKEGLEVFEEVFRLIWL